MKKTKCLNTLFLSGLLLFNAGLTWATAMPESAQEKSATSQSVQAQVDKASAKKVATQTSKITKEAVAAVEETMKALEALEKGKTDDALKSLETATGKLELILTRDPALALIPVNVDVVTYDLYADVDTVKAVVKEAQQALDDGKVQTARHLMESLSSEVVISTTNIPLGTYPEAIKAISPLLDKGKIEEAKVALKTALSSLVVSTEVVPLPLLRSQYLLDKAESLAENKERDEKQNASLDALLKGAEEELHLAEVLGYGNGHEFKPLYEQIKAIKKKAAGGNGGSGWFDEMKKLLSELF